MRVAIYARVSTSDKGQHIDMQLNELRNYAEARQWTITAEYKDEGISGAKLQRSAFQELLKDARQRKIDVVLCWKLDRFSRSLKDLVNTLSDLQELKVDFVSLKDNIDMTTSAGRLMFHIVASFSEFERDIIRERVKSGLQNAKRKGRRLGREPIPPITHRQIIDAHIAEPSLSIRKLARKVHQTPATVFKTLQKYRAKEIDPEGYQVSTN